MDLHRLEYPRHLHQPGGRWVRVNNVTEAAAAVADGWYVDPNCREQPIPPDLELPPRPDTVVVPEEVPIPDPTPRSRRSRGGDRS